LSSRNGITPVVGRCSGPLRRSQLALQPLLMQVSEDGILAGSSGGANKLIVGVGRVSEDLWVPGRFARPFGDPQAGASAPLRRRRYFGVVTSRLLVSYWTERKRPRRPDDRRAAHPPGRGDHGIARLAAPARANAQIPIADGVFRRCRIIVYTPLYKTIRYLRRGATSARFVVILPPEVPSWRAVRKSARSGPPPAPVTDPGGSRSRTRDRTGGQKPARSRNSLAIVRAGIG
jgi:hypothetical protein